MDTIPPRLTTALACKVARLDRDRFNEAVSEGFLECAPPTVAGRTRHFEPDDMIAVWLYRELTEDGYSRQLAGRIACEVSIKAHLNPTAKDIAYVEPYAARAHACLPEDILAAGKLDDVMSSGSNIRRMTIFNVESIRRLIARETAEQIRTFGPED